MCIGMGCMCGGGMCRGGMCGGGMCRGGVCGGGMCRGAWGVWRWDGKWTVDHIEGRLHGQLTAWRRILSPPRVYTGGNTGSSSIAFH